MGPRVDGSPPHCAINPFSNTELESIMSPDFTLVPKGTSSSPVVIIATLGLPITEI